jgi:hypothetical protein
MDLVCDYNKFGCRAKLANDDHLNAHLRDNVAAHLKLVCSAFEKEVEKNKLLDEKLETIYKIMKDSASRENLRVQESNKVFKEGPRPDGKPLDVISKEPVKEAAVKEEPTPAPYQPHKPNKEEVVVVSAPSTPELKDRDNEEGGYMPIRRTQSSSAFSGTIGKRRSGSSPGGAAASGAASLNPIGDNSSRSERRNSKRRSATGVVSDEELPEGFERGYLWEYDPSNDEWARGQLVFKMEQASFAAGALRTAHMVEIISTVAPVDILPDGSIQGDKTLKSSVPLEIGKFGDQYVAKLSKTPVPVERYFEDVKMQCVVRELAIKFNNQGTPKKVEFLMAWVLEIPRGDSTLVVGLEPYIAGNFTKNSNNVGLVLSDRNTPQAFSHYTWEHTNHNMVVVDLQGLRSLIDHDI